MARKTRSHTTTEVGRVCICFTYSALAPGQHAQSKGLQHGRHEKYVDGQCEFRAGVDPRKGL